MKKNKTELGVCGVGIDKDTLTECKIKELLINLSTNSTYCNNTRMVRVTEH
jgi:hypothetical protein